MQRSTDRILTTHVGSLPGRGEAGHDNPDAAAIRAIVDAQRDAGIDIVNEGEFTKGGDWLSFIDGRLGGFETASAAGAPLLMQGRDRETFAEFYKFAAERGTLFYVTRDKPAVKRVYRECTGPITYTGQAALQREIDLFKAALGAEAKADTFLTTTAPASLEPYHANRYYRTTEEFLFAFADAMRVEYEMIANAGFLVQVDDAWLAALWERIGVGMGLDAFRKYCMLRVDALNHALRNIPEDRIRYHLCWGSWHGPHAFDIPLRDIVDILLRVKAQAYLIEGANARHEHEYHVWEDVKLPAGKILIPGVVAHATDTIEHPELVSERIQRYAARVGRENVIAGTDCGFGERTHPQIAWAKLRAMSEGAALATAALKFS
ncbi:MAG: cobalamin-independent methionine synthase II family protein [Pseudorhodoplanes sp.]|uniref:cobalamin-independent methionine synthase II family protein n=1 Tax=Pseudorhodoplanes sp. TaxID=1934341 RepID=UPI003D128C1B